MRKVVVTGAECSGKSALSADLAGHYGVTWVPEMAREYLGQLGRPYREEDLLKIAELQLHTEEERASEAGSAAPFLVCDTDLITIRIWGEEKYGRSDPWIVQQTEERPYDLWLLCRPDIPWVYDPLRENPHDRDRLFAVYEKTLKALAKPYVIIEGGREERLKQAIAAIGGLGQTE
ncbi:MAG: ATP-binding protein [Flavobacteriales bacterium]|nr:ATP-binding protein [Flavobacteriales bacterium]